MSGGHGNSSETQEENNRLRQRVRQLESREKVFYERVERHFTDLVGKYRDSTMKECMLLMDRYRLECKHAEKER